MPLETLRVKGPEVGSREWFKAHCSPYMESEGMQKVRDKLADEGRDESDVYSVTYDWLWTQHFFTICEVGVGKVIPIQPPYLGKMFIKEGSLVLEAFNLPEYGNQKDSYISFEGIDISVRKGLELIYETLINCQPGDGLMRVSPTEFYESQGSDHDVVEFYQVDSILPDGSVKMRGRYLILERALSPEERCFVNNWHAGVDDTRSVVGTSGEIIEYSPYAFVLNPQKVNYDSNEEAATLDHIMKLNEVFRNKFGKPLVGETDFAMYKLIEKMIDEKNGVLVELLLEKRYDEYLDVEREMMFASQRIWALRNGIDPDEHVMNVRMGRVPIGWAADGFGIGGFGEMVWDPVAKKWFDGGSDGKKHCFVHEEDYWGESCPKCLPAHNHNNYQNYLAA